MKVEGGGIRSAGEGRGGGWLDFGDFGDFGGLDGRWVRRAVWGVGDGGVEEEESITSSMYAADIVRVLSTSRLVGSSGNQ